MKFSGLTLVFLLAISFTVQPQTELHAKLGDLVWHDLNRNGIQDPGEPGLQWITVNLYDCNDNWIAYTLTDANGYYHFNVSPGDYYLKFTLIDQYENYAFSPKQAGSDPELDSDVNPQTGNTDCITVAVNQNNMTIDAGIFDPEFNGFAKVGNRVWNDLNADGIQDQHEPGLQWVTVNLYSCSGQWLDYRLTDENGFYSFDSLAPGSYYLKFVTGNIYTTYVFSPKNQGNDPELDSDADPSTGKTVCFTLSEFQTDLSWDAGLHDSHSAKVWINKDDHQLFMPGAGQQVTYDINFGNSSFKTFNNVTIKDTLPPGTQFVSCSGNFDCGETSPGSNVVVFNIGTLGPLQEGLVQVTASVTELLDEYRNVACIKAKDSLGGHHWACDTDINIADSCSGGGGGGIESRGDMAELLLKRHIKIQSGQTTPLLSKVNGNPVLNFQLEQFIPEAGPFNSIPVETTPFDILGISNAIAAYAVDYNLVNSGNIRRVAAIFSTITSAPDIYDHTKVVCDRLAGYSLEQIDMVMINGRLFYSGKLHNPETRNTDYAISFSAYETPAGFVVENKWTYDEYEAPSNTINVYNFQVWSSSIESTRDLVIEVLALLNNTMPVTYKNNQQIPPVVFIKNASYMHDGTIKLTVENTETPRSLSLNIFYRVSQGAEKISSQKVYSVNEGITEIEIPFGIISDAEIKMQQQQGFMDEVYVSGGAYTYVEGPLSSVTEFQTAQYPQQNPANYPEGSLILSGGALVTGNLGDWVSVIRSLKASWLEYDLSMYSSVSFTAQGYGTVDVILDMTNTQNYNYYTYTINLSGEQQNFHINFSDFAERFGPQTPFDASKIRSIGFIFDKNKNPGVNWFSAEFRNIAFQTGLSNAEEGSFAPDKFSLSQNYPNPFNPSTVIEFSVPKRENVSLKIFNVLGQEVVTLLNGEVDPGYHSVTFNTASLKGGLASGIYFYRLQGSSVNITKKMILSK